MRNEVVLQEPAEVPATLWSGSGGTEIDGPRPLAATRDLGRSRFGLTQILNS